MSHPTSDLIFCDKCENNINEDDEAIEKHSCGKPYYICMTCEGH
jgi:hypothetical protein